jgi:hypothetical protein
LHRSTDHPSFVDADIGVVAPAVGRNRKAWGVSPRYLRACNFSKPQRGRHRIVPAPRRQPFHVTPLGFKTKRATRVSLAPGSWGSRPGFMITPLCGWEGGRLRHPSKHLFAQQSRNEPPGRYDLFKPNFSPRQARSPLRISWSCIDRAIPLWFRLHFLPTSRKAPHRAPQNKSQVRCLPFSRKPSRIPRKGLADGSQDRAAR